MGVITVTEFCAYQQVYESAVPTRPNQLLRATAAANRVMRAEETVAGEEE